MSTLGVVFVSYFCSVWSEARIVVLSLWKVGIPHCLWLLRFFEAGHTISDKPCPFITEASWIWSLLHKYLIFQSSVSTFNCRALVGTQRSVLTFQKLLKQTCYCLLYILGFKTLELTLGVYCSCLCSFGTSQQKWKMSWSKPTRSQQSNPDGKCWVIKKQNDWFCFHQ